MNDLFQQPDFLPAHPRFALAELLACATREAAMRRACYPRWDKAATLDQLTPGRKKELAMMEAIAAVLAAAPAQAATPTPGGEVWVAVGELTGREEHEWLHVLLPNNTVEPALYTEHGGEWTWCQWEEERYTPMPTQPTHYHPAPSPHGARRPACRAKEEGAGAA